MLLLSVVAILFCIASGDVVERDKIVGGRSIAISDCPYQASLQNKGIHFCGGSIIRKNVILSAAHCIRGVIGEKLSDLTVRVGSSMWSTGGQVKNIVGMKAHPKYNPTTKEADIGLILLGSPINFGTMANLILLADGVPPDGKIGIISGWGVTAEQGFTIPTMLKIAEVTSISRKNCSQPPWEYGDEILPSMICAQGKGKDSCQGDSGGPYVSKSSGKLWGVVSWGRGCARDGYPGVYVAVVAFKKWITNNADNF